MPDHFSRTRRYFLGQCTGISLGAMSAGLLLNDRVHMLSSKSGVKAEQLSVNGCHTSVRLPMIYVSSSRCIVNTLTMRLR